MTSWELWCGLPAWEQAVETAYWSGAVYGALMTLLLLGMFVVVGGKVVVERFTRNEWSQSRRKW